jgi:Fuc2NAc and GlcNAc transferase
VSLSLPVVFLFALAISAICAGVLTYFTQRLNLLDTPNRRSSHTVPTPRGGGVAIVATSSVSFLALAWLGFMDYELAFGLFWGGLAVAIIGFVDDYRSVSTWSRLMVHLSAALWALYILDGTLMLQVGTTVVELDGLWNLVCVLGVMWLLNLFNFMDGIDGIAASEAIFVLLAGGVLSLSMGISSGIGLGAGVVTGSCIGFLVWNWAPAKIFMGDVGSGYLGYVIAVLVLAAAAEHPVMIPIWLVLGALFFVDATVTLLRRIARGERPYEAHRTHAYQWLARRWGSHRRVTLGLSFLNLTVLLPVAIWCALQPERSIYIMLGAVGLLGAAAVVVGSGQSEPSIDSRT